MRAELPQRLCVAMDKVAEMRLAVVVAKKAEPRLSRNGTLRVYGAAGSVRTFVDGRWEMQWWLWLLITSAPVLLALFVLYFGTEAKRWDRRMQAAIKFIPEEEDYRIALPFWRGTGVTYWGVLYRAADGWRVKDSGWFILRWRDDTSNRAHRAHPDEKVWSDPWAAERIIRKSVVSTLALIEYNDARGGKPLTPKKCRARARLRWVGLQTNDAALERAKLLERRAEFERRD